MKKIIFLKLYTDITKYFLITIFTLVSIIWILQAVNYLDIISEDGHSVSTYFNYSFLNIPKIFTKTFILSFLLSLFYVLVYYDESNQLLIYWSNRIDKKYFFNKIFLLTVFYCLILISLSVWVVPYTQDKARSFIRSSNLDFFTSLIKPRKFIDTVENLTLFIDEKDGNKIKKIFLKDASKENIQIIISKKGQIINIDDDKFLKLQNGNILMMKDNNFLNVSKQVDGTSFSFKETNIDLSTYNTKTTTTSKIQELNSLKIFKCLKILNNDKAKKFANFNCNKNMEKNLNQELYKRIFLPFYIILISLIITFLILKTHLKTDYKSWKIKIFIMAILILAFSQISINLITEDKLRNIIIILVLPISLLISNFFFSRKVKF